MSDDPWDIIERLKAAHTELFELAAGTPDASRRKGAANAASREADRQQRRHTERVTGQAG